MTDQELADEIAERYFTTGGETVVGVCPTCGHSETRKTNSPKQWTIGTPIWTWCHGVGFGGHLTGIIFKEVETREV